MTAGKEGRDRQGLPEEKGDGVPAPAPRETGGLGSGLGSGPGRPRLGREPLHPRAARPGKSVRPEAGDQACSCEGGAGARERRPQDREGGLGVPETRLSPPAALTGRL